MKLRAAIKRAFYYVPACHLRYTIILICRRVKFLFHKPIVVIKYKALLMVVNTFLFSLHLYNFHVLPSPSASREPQWTISDVRYVKIDVQQRASLRNRIRVLIIAE